MIDINELRRLTQAVVKGWGNCDQAWLDQSEDAPAAAVGHIDEDGNTYPVATIDCDQYYAAHQSLPLAKFYAAANPAAISELLDRLEAAENENAKLRIALAEKVTSETTLRDLSVGNGSINATFEGGAVQLMLDALADQFVESGASNIEMQFHSKAGPLLFTLQRVDGKTPHQLRAEAEKERDALRAKIERMERQEPIGCVESLFDEYVIIHNNFDRAAPVYLAPGAQEQQAPSVPDGWKLVPIVPTKEMIDKVIDERIAALLSGKDHSMLDIYHAMLAAAPKPEE